MFYGFPVTIDPDQFALITSRLDAIVAQLKTLNRMETNVMSVLDDIEAEVAKQTSVEGSVETLISNLAQAVKSAGTDPARLNAILTALKNNDERLAQLVADNTAADQPAQPTAPQDTSGLPPA